MGGGGGGSSSSTSSATTNLDKRQVVDGNSIGVSSDSSTVNVTALDGGAIDKAGAAVNAALNTVQLNDAIQGQNLSSIISLAGGLFQGGFQALKTSQAQVTEAYHTAQQQQNDKATLPNNYIIAGAVALVAAVAMGRRK